MSRPRLLGRLLASAFVLVSLTQVGQSLAQAEASAREARAPVTSPAQYASPSEAGFIHNFGRLQPVERIDEHRIMLDGRVYATNQQVILRTGLSKAELEQRYSGQIAGIAELAKLPKGALHVLRLPQGVDSLAFALSLLDDDDIEYAQPDLLAIASGNAGLPTQEALRALNDLPAPVRALWGITTGRGVRLALIDDGFDFSHDELAHLDPVFTYDADLNVISAAPKGQMDTHGTRVAGLIYARHDDKGVEGIAPNAELIAVRQADGWTSHIVLAFTVAQLAGADIVNCSWAISYLPQPVAEVIEALTVHGRDGKGALVVVSAGNQGGTLSEHNGLAGIPGVLTVGALARRAGGSAMAGYSNNGDGLDLLAPTDLLSLSAHHGYHRFGGTSAAAALVSGTAALLLAHDTSLGREELVEALQEYFPSPEGVSR